MSEDIKSEEQIVHSLSEYHSLAEELVKKFNKHSQNEKEFQKNLERFLSGDAFIP